MRVEEPRKRRCSELPSEGVFTQMTRRQNARPGTDWTVFLMLSVGRHDKFDARASKKICLCENPLFLLAFPTRVAKRPARTEAHSATGASRSRSKSFPFP